MKENYEKYINRKAYADIGGLKIAVVIMDIKERWGKLRFLISPVSGKGEIWIEKITL